MKQFGMIAGDPLIPIAIRLPFSSAVRRRTKDVAFARQDEIGVDRKIEIGQARFEQFHGPAGIDRPEDTSFLQLFDLLHAAAIQSWIAPVSDQGAVEVAAE